MIDIKRTVYNQSCLPKFMAPRHNGDTLTPALGERIRWYPNGEGGFWAGGNRDMISDNR